MKASELLSIFITLIGLVSFATLFTFMYNSFAKGAINDIKTGKRDMDLIKTIVDVKDEKKKKAFGIFKNALFYIILILIVPLFIFSMVNKFNGKVSYFGGKSTLIVASGSMSEKNPDNVYVNDESLQENYNMDNQFSKFDIVIIEEVNDPSEIELYDVIAFKNKKGENVIHRVINIHNNDGEISYVTQGDALDREDGIRPSYDDVVGKYTSKRIKGLGAIVLFCQSYAGIITILSLIYILSMLEHMNAKVSKEEKNRVLELKEVLDYKDDSQPIKTYFYEEIHYKGMAYRFNDDGFIDKKAIDANDTLETIEREKKDD